jgi:uncharacterized repeat protein (TIGR01451 family)/LPXTG-motif cell wall-anchored protein
LDNGSVNDSATAHGTPPSGPPVVSPPSDISIPAPTEPALSLVKSADVDTAHDVGDKVVYSFLVTNTGNASQSDIQIDDQLVAPAGPALTVTCPPTTLEPGESLTCTSSEYTVTQADVDHGRIDNTATASGQPPAAGGQTPPRTVSEPSDEDVTIPDEPGINLVKDVEETEFEAGDTLHYTFLVTNTGNTTLNNIVVNDPLPGLSAVSCPKTTLVSGEEMTCTATYHATKADAERGEVLNSATAEGASPNGDQVSRAGDVEIPVVEADSNPNEPGQDGPDSSDNPLPSTGTSADRIGLLGLMLLVTGGGFLALSRRRRSS